MNRISANQLADTLMEKWRLYKHGWNLEFDNSKKRFGCCRFGPKVISLSRHLVELNAEEDVRDTILHEIAHALVGPGHGHDRVWKQMCRVVGAKPERLYDHTKVISPLPRWILRCLNCGRTTKRFRLGKIPACGKCCDVHNNGKYAEKFKLKVESGGGA